ncbi:hypothetical protein GWI33_023299 [Rhynchophorus ferrugineus]|uniref:Uncharacterized protein n=1 Tax=Rhynchophorus ferrugineus TaxID=354439 RepID=A0A834MM66_RHYFE|nr:hypothetical protein GWI33_023299 [Rhynchophorus ferrugineus]
MRPCGLMDKASDFGSEDCSSGAASQSRHHKLPVPPNPARRRSIGASYHPLDIPPPSSTWKDAHLSRDVSIRFSLCPRVGIRPWQNEHGPTTIERAARFGYGPPQILPTVKSIFFVSIPRGPSNLATIVSDI